MVLLLLSALFSASETAFFSLPSLKVRLFQTDTHRSRRFVAKLLEKPRDLLVIILMFNIGVNIGVQNVVSSMFGIYSNGLLTIGLPLLLTLFFGEAIPKSIAISYNEKITVAIAPIFVVLRWCLSLIRWLFISIASVISRISFFFLRKEQEISTEEIQHALKTSKENGVLLQDEEKLISGAMQVDEMIVKELMRPRQDILYFSIEGSLQQLVHLFVDEECSKLPVVDGDLDNILGIVTSDLYFLHRNEIDQSGDVRQCLEKPFFVPTEAVN